MTIVIAAAEPGFKIKEWQPLIAALIALGGGTFAYRGAMAKIYADQERDRVELDRKKLGLYLRFQFAVRRMIAEARRHRLLMKRDYREGENIRYTIRVDDLRFGVFEEFDEAWKNLDLLPRTVSFNLDQVRDVLAKDRAFLDSLKVEFVEDVVFVFYGHPLYPCESANEYLEKAGLAVEDELGREISRLK
jgi:hypothetical protein